MPVIALPLLWVAAMEAAAATAFILSAALAGAGIHKAVQEIDAALDQRARDTPIPVPLDIPCIECQQPKCPPCVPPAGTIRVERVDRVPPGRRHAPCPGDHAHLVQMNQVPYPGCKCFWNKANPDVACLGPGDPLPYPMK